MISHPSRAGRAALLALTLTLYPFLKAAAAETPTPGALPQPPKIPPQAELEKRFTGMLNKATFVGRFWTVKNGQLGPVREEKYTIHSVGKIKDNLWLVNTRIQYGERDLTVPIPVFVDWAGDTAVISITDLTIPGGGTYTARVLVYDDQYAGTWAAKDHGGQLSGLIQRK